MFGKVNEPRCRTASPPPPPPLLPNASALGVNWGEEAIAAVLATGEAVRVDEEDDKLSSLSLSTATVAIGNVGIF